MSEILKPGDDLGRVTSVVPFPDDPGYIDQFISFFTPGMTHSSPRDQGAAGSDMQNSRPDHSLKTIEGSLNRFDLPLLLEELERSLENVKRNKTSKEDHLKFMKDVDKKLQKLSLQFHPDHAGRGSNLDAVDAHELQSALNATRKLLKMLTNSFLEDIFVDYKYEYFSKLDISVFVNENEIENRIQAILYKISMLSEIKRMNIIGEIRKFLLESQRCVKSYFVYNKKDFAKYRDYALYHLQKNIEGYAKLERECNMLIEECSEENDENTRSVLQSVMRRSFGESTVLRSLEGVAKRSFKGKFQIFSIDEIMDEYYILPFVDYVNFLSMCNLVLNSKVPRFSISRCIPPYKEKRPLLRDAYALASAIYLDISRNMKVEDIMEIYDVKVLNEILLQMSDAFEIKFRVDAYNEGKSNRFEMHEKLLSLEKVMEDLTKKEETFRECVNLYEKERKELSEAIITCRRDTEGNCE